MAKYERRPYLSVIRNYKFRSVFIKSLFMIVVLVLVPFAVMCYVIYEQWSGLAEEEISSASLNSLYRVRDTVDQIFQSADLMATKISLRNDVEFFLLSGDVGGLTNSQYREMYNTITMLTHIYRYIDSVYIFSEKSQYLISNRFSGPLQVSNDDTWYEFYKQREDNHPFILARKRGGIYPYFVSVVRPAYIYQQEKTGVVVINIDMQELGRALINTKDILPQQVYIIDRDNRIIYSEDRNDFLQSYDALHIPVDGRREQSMMRDIGDQNYVVSALPSLRQEWLYVSLIPLQYYEQKLHNLNRFVTVFFVLGFMTAVIISWIIAYRTYQPVKQIVLALEKPGSRTNARTMKQDNEIGFILHNIAETIDSKQQLEQELNRRLALLHKAQSLALQSQINPHFLANTLETINWKAMNLFKGKNEISDMVDALSRLMQASMRSESVLVPIGQEIEHVKRYIDLVQYRFKDRITVHWDIDDSLQHYQTINLCLQPLIENAIKHGIQAKREKGDIWIRIRDLGHLIAMEVEDNGAGMSKAKQDMLLRKLNDAEEAPDEHIGLQNVNQRLQLIFGEKCGLHIESVEGAGTKMWMAIPKAN